MTAGLTVTLHDPAGGDPPGWAGFVASQGLPAVWDWTMVRATAAGHRSAILAATIHDGPDVCALVTARFPGLRTRHGAIPMAGVVDVDCLVSASLPGIALPDGVGAELFGEAVAALRDALRREYGRRFGALMLRQVPADLLPAALRWPAIVREGGPIVVFHNRFSDFDGYLAALHRGRRQSLRAVMRRLDADPELTVSLTGRGDPAVPLDAARLTALAARVVNRHHHRWYLRKRLPRATVTGAILEHPGVHRLTYHDGGGTLLAYATAWDHPRWPLLGSWGALDPAEGGRKHLWFHMMGTFVRWCIESDRQGMVMGQGSIADKVSLGHEAHRQWAMLIPQRHGRTRA